MQAWGDIMSRILIVKLIFLLLAKLTEGLSKSLLPDLKLKLVENLIIV